MDVIAETQVGKGYIAEFQDFSASRAQESPWLTALRREGYTQFSEAGFPTTHDEDWRFTNVSAIAQTRFELDDAGAGAKLTAKDLDQFNISAFPCCLVFVNGRFSPELSRFPDLPEGVRVGSLAQAVGGNEAEIEDHLGKYLNFQRDAFAALNTAFMDDGACIYIPRSTVVE